MINEKPEARPLKEIVQTFKNFWVWYGQEWFLCFKHNDQIIGTNGKRHINLDAESMEGLEAIGIKHQNGKNTVVYSDNELLALAMECGFVLMPNPSPNKRVSPVADTKTILSFAKMIMSGKRPVLDLPEPHRAGA